MPVQELMQVQPQISKPTKNTKWPTLTGEGFAFASFSDLHLGHQRNNTELMIQALDKSLYSDGLLSFVKVLFLAGDVFDRLLSLNDEAVPFIDRWIAKLLKSCAQAGVCLRVMEGTKSHDRNQSQRFKDIYDLLELKSDFKYITDVQIEHLECVGANVLFIPDEAHPSTIETQAVVKAILNAKGLSEVDISVMHGYFKHQLPFVTKEGSYHDLDYYESITKHWITIGHVHNRTRVGKALAQGSHDRLKHGEEEDKGFVVATCRETNADQFWFINNTLAHTYRAVLCYDLTSEQALASVDTACDGLRPNSRISIEAEPEHPIFQSMLYLTNRWPLLHLTKNIKTRNDKTIAEKILDDELSNWSPIRIDSESIGPLIEKRLLKRELKSDQQQRILNHLSECV